MTEEQKIEALHRILQGANVAQVNLGDGYQTFNLGKDGACQQESTPSAEVMDDAPSADLHPASAYTSTELTDEEKVSESRPQLPPELSTPEAIALLEKARQAGYLDEQYQPVGLSHAKQAILANTIAETLGIEQKWLVFEGLWKSKNMAQSYQQGMKQIGISKFLKNIEILL